MLKNPKTESIFNYREIKKVEQRRVRNAREQTESERMNCQYPICIDTQSNTSCKKYLLPVRRKNSRVEIPSIDGKFVFSPSIPRTKMRIM